ncbi:MAG: hypothetical protein SW833_27705, partial [Cyanobacteriota bacterium]|nr:hypothetical protein [Cyanobacteriota bacterium]
MISTVSGVLNSNDGNNPTRSGRYYDDYILTDLPARTSVQLNLNGVFDTYLQLIDAETGEAIANNDDGGPGLNSQLTFTPDSSIDYIVRATSFGSGATGTYNLITTTGELLALTNTINGTLDSSDSNNPTRNGRYHDDYSLDNLTVGQQVQVNLDGAFDTYLQLINGDTGAVIANNDDGGSGLNSQLNFTVESGVDYVIRATSFGSGATGEYGLTTTAGSFSSVADEPAEPAMRAARSVVPETYRPFDASQVFNLNSNARANHTIYLDFDGHRTTGTPWNSRYGNNLVTPAYSTDSDTSR